MLNPFWLSLRSGAIATVTLPLVLTPVFAQGLPSLPPEAETGIEIPVEPAPEAQPPASATARGSASSNPIETALASTVLEILTQSMGQVIKGEPVDISPDVAVGIAEAIAAQVEAAAQAETAPQGLSEMARVMRIAIEGGSETEIRRALQDAITILMSDVAGSTSE
ncbi:MAG: hypothetical protein AAGG51_16060 [Cyanobacteria bacterium P01_G01_bin.54]